MYMFLKYYDMNDKWVGSRFVDAFQWIVNFIFDTVKFMFEIIRVFYLWEQNHVSAQHA